MHVPRCVARREQRQRCRRHAGPVACVERNGLSLWLGDSDSAGPLALDASTSSKESVRPLTVDALAVVSRARSELVATCDEVP
jgi:hypothetical protein